MEAGFTRRGLVIAMAGLLLFCGLLWFALGDDPPSGPSAPPPETGHRTALDDPAAVAPDSDAGGATTAESRARGIRHEPIPPSRPVAYGGRVLDESGRALEGLTPRLWGRTGEPSSPDGTFSVPLDPTDIPAFRAGGRLVFTKPGFQSPVIEPRPIGFRGEDEVRIPMSRGPRLKLWWLDTRKPLAGHRVTLNDRQGRFIRSGKTERDGTFVPFWEDHHHRTYLDVEVEGGPIRYVLDRAHVLESYPLHLFVPRIGNALRFDIVCRDGAGRAVPNASAQVSFAGGRGFLLDFVTDGEGRGRAHYWLTDKEYDPSQAWIATWRAWWKSSAGVVRFSDAEVKDRPTIRRDEPFVMELELERSDWYRGGVAILVRTAGTGRPVRPISISGHTVAPRGVPPLTGSFRESPETSQLDPDGRCPRRIELMGSAGDWPWEDEIPFRMNIHTDDRPMVLKDIPMGVIRRAMESGQPLVVEVPALTYRRVFIQVLAPEGTPVLFPRLSIDGPDRLRSLLGDAKGLASLGHLPAGQAYRAVVIDPATGDGGCLLEFRPADAREVTRLRLETARALTFRVRRAGGAVPGGIRVALVDRSRGRGRTVAPRVLASVTDDNLVTFPPAALSLYDLSIGARRVKNVRIPATEVGEMVVID